MSSERKEEKEEEAEDKEEEEEEEEEEDREEEEEERGEMYRLDRAALSSTHHSILQHFIHSIFVHVSFASPPLPTSPLTPSHPHLLRGSQLLRLRLCCRLLVALEAGAVVNQPSLCLQAVVLGYGLLSPLIQRGVITTAIAKVSVSGSQRDYHITTHNLCV